MEQITITFLSALFVMHIQISPLHAQCTWNATSGNWSDPSKWSNCGGSTPLATSDVLIAGGSVVLDIAPVVNNFTLNGGTSITGTNNLNINGALTINSNSQLGNTGDIIVAGTFTQTGGTIGDNSGSATGTVTVNGYATFSGGGYRYLNTKTLNLNGGGLLNDAVFILQYGSIMNIPVGQTFTTHAGYSAGINGTNGTVNNNGNWSKTGSAVFECYPVFNNNGSVQVADGTCRFITGGTHSGTYSHNTGTTLEFGGGTNDLSACTLTGTGVLKISGGTVTLPNNSTHADVVTSNSTTWFSGNNVMQNLTANSGTLNFQGTLSVQNLSIGNAYLKGNCDISDAGNFSIGNGGQLGNTGNTTIAGTFTQTGGTIGDNSGSATGTVTVNGYATISGNAYKYLNGKTLNFNGGGIINDSYIILQYGAALNLGAGQTFVVYSGYSAAISGLNGIVNNYGIFEKQGTANFNCEPAFNNFGTIKGIAICTFYGSVGNAGLVSPGASPGILYLNKGGAGIPITNLDIELEGPNPGTNGYDQVINTTGPIALNNGTLNVTLLNGYEPPVGASFTILSATTRSGAFSTLNLPVSNDRWSVAYNANNVVLTVIQSLPVELIDFQAISIEDVVKLSWETASEKNNSGFSIERSQDGVEFNEIGFVEGAGNSDSHSNYHFLDKTFPTASTLFYRLRIIDLNGNAEYSSICVVRLSNLSTFIISTNVSNTGFLTLTSNLQVDSDIRVQLIDTQGRSVKIWDLGLVERGEKTVTLDCSTYPQGIYILLVESDTEIIEATRILLTSPK